MYNDVINDHIPLKKVKMQGKQVPFMNRELRTAIRLRKQLWTKYKKTGEPSDHLNYKQQRNLTVKLRRKAIALYFGNATMNAIANPRRFWKTFKPFLHTKSAMSANDIVLQENGEMVKERTNVAKIFNDYFVTICSSIDAGFNSNDFASHPSILSIKDLMSTKRDPQDKFSFNEVPDYVVADICTR